MEGLEAWARSVRRFGVDAAPGTDACQVALMLVASVDIGHNVERLARRTGSSRQLVSKAARRFIDSAVWADGRTIGLWVTDPTAGDAFLRDVDVGLGRLLRRIGPAGGMEWAEPGRWTKSFDPDEQAEAPAATYVDAPPRPAEPIALAEEREPARPAARSDQAQPAAPAAAEPAPAPLPTAGATAPAPEPDPAPAGQQPDGEPSEGESEPPPSLDEVFAGTVWLR